MSAPTFQTSRVTSMRAPLVVGRRLAVLALVLLGAAAEASPPAANGLGATFRLVSRGSTNTVEIRLAPSASFESVSVEAASGATALTPPCAFASVVPGGSYVCRVNVTHQSGAASLSLNVVGHSAVGPSHVRVVETSHYTIPNPGYTRPAGSVRRASRPPAPTLLLTPPGAAAK